MRVCYIYLLQDNGRGLMPILCFRHNLPESHGFIFLATLLHLVLFLLSYSPNAVDGSKNKAMCLIRYETRVIVKFKLSGNIENIVRCIILINEAKGGQNGGSEV